MTIKPGRATADCWYDFGFRTLVIRFESGREKVISVPDQSDKHAPLMRYLWKLHIFRRAMILEA